MKCVSSDIDEVRFDVVPELKGLKHKNSTTYLKRADPEDVNANSTNDQLGDDSKGIKKQKCKCKIVDARKETGSVEVNDDVIVEVGAD